MDSSRNRDSLSSQEWKQAEEPRQVGAVMTSSMEEGEPMRAICIASKFSCLEILRVFLHVFCFITCSPKYGCWSVGLPLLLVSVPISDALFPVQVSCHIKDSSDEDFLVYPIVIFFYF